jgi:hypothetical protein
MFYVYNEDLPSIIWDVNSGRYVAWLGNNMLTHNFGWDSAHKAVMCDEFGTGMIMEELMFTQW